jgi:hypothetical protein
MSRFFAVEMFISDATEIIFSYAISWEAFLEPSDSYFLLADLVGFYPH